MNGVPSSAVTSNFDGSIAAVLRDEFSVDLPSAANTMANLYSLYAYVSYTDPGSGDTVTGDKYFYQRHLFDRADGDSCRTVEVKIPADWDADEPYVLTNGVLSFYGNCKDIGSHRNSLPNLSISCSP